MVLTKVVNEGNDWNIIVKKMKSIAFAAVFGAVFAAASAPANITRCTEADYHKIQADAKWSLYRPLCAHVLGLSLSEFDNHTSPTEENEAKLKDSDVCKWFYGDIQKYARRANCYELDLIGSNITWDMVVELMDVEAVPKVQNNCSKVELTGAFTGLAAKSSFYKCVGTSSKNLFTVPDANQLALFRANPACSDLFNDFQAVIDGLPHCAVHGDGTDVHAFRKLSWNVTLDWLNILSSSQTAPAVPGAVVFALNYVPRLDGHSIIVLATGGLFACAIIAFAAFFIYKKQVVNAKPASRREERVGLLHV
ncbi:unnamed protein product [Aphanomyces euteiches]